MQGIESELAGKVDACAGCANQEMCSSSKPKGPDPALPLIKQRMANVKRKILVLSGKGGVGKSTFTAQLAWAFASDDETQVRFSILQRTTPSPLKTLKDGYHGRRHLWSLHPYDSRYSFRTSTRVFIRLVLRYMSKTTWASCLLVSCSHHPKML